MRHYKLTAEQAAANCGFTDLYVIPYTDLTASALNDNTAKNITLETFAVGDVIYNRLVVVATAFAGPSDLTGTVSLGTTADTGVEGTEALTIITGGTGAAAGTNKATPTTWVPWRPGAAAVYAVFNADADSGVDEYTAGEVRIWLQITRQSDRATIQA
jgi:hypothetical protein